MNDWPPRFTRRRFATLLARGAAGAAALAALPSCAHAPLGQESEAAAQLIERSDRPEQWEPTLDALGRDWLTPNEWFFVRSHLMTPQLDAGTWRLDIEGMVSRGRTFTLDQIKKVSPQVEHAITIECAGNGRGLMPLASTSGTQWTHGAVSNARWAGVPLSAVLDLVGASKSATHVWFEGADMAPMPDVPKFIRSLPIEVAREGTLLAHTMNRQPLPVLHGYPLRAVTPGWYGMASTKWLTRISVEDRPSDNHFQIRGYRWNKPGEDPTQASPVETIRVKSVITRPVEGTTLQGERALFQGFAWAGPANVTKVEVRLDDAAWVTAEFRGEKQPGAWRSWAIELPVAAGRHTLMARATDGRGETQPMEPQVNAGGYGNNRIHQVTFDVRA